MASGSSHNRRACCICSPTRSVTALQLAVVAGRISDALSPILTSVSQAPMIACATRGASWQGGRVSVSFRDITCDCVAMTL